MENKADGCSVNPTCEHCPYKGTVVCGLQERRTEAPESGAPETEQKQAAPCGGQVGVRYHTAKNTRREMIPGWIYAGVFLAVLISFTLVFARCAQVLPGQRYVRQQLWSLGFFALYFCIGCIYIRWEKKRDASPQDRIAWLPKAASIAFTVIAGLIVFGALELNMPSIVAGMIGQAPNLLRIGIGMICVELYQLANWVYMAFGLLFLVFAKRIYPWREGGNKFVGIMYLIYFGFEVLTNIFAKYIDLSFIDYIVF